MEQRSGSLDWDWDVGGAKSSEDQIPFSFSPLFSNSIQSHTFNCVEETRANG